MCTEVGEKKCFLLRLFYLEKVKTAAQTHRTRHVQGIRLKRERMAQGKASVEGMRGGLA